MLLNDGIAAFTGFNPDMVTALPTDAYGSTYIPEVRESLGMFLLCHGLQGFSVYQAGGIRWMVHTGMWEVFSGPISSF